MTNIYLFFNFEIPMGRCTTEKADFSQVFLQVIFDNGSKQNEEHLNTNGLIAHTHLISVRQPT